jgi:hypothetical protein
MTAQVRQQVGFAISATGQATATLSGVLSGSCLVFIVYDGSSAHTTSATDNHSNTYTRVDNNTTFGGFYTIDVFVAQNVTGGSVTVTGGQTVSFPWGCLFEVSGVTSTALDGHTINFQGAPGSGANAITVGPPSPNNASTPALVVGVTAAVDNGGTADGLETAGTGYTMVSGTPLNPWGGTGNAIAIETVLLNSGTSSAVTFKAGGSGVGTYGSAVLIFDQAAAANLASIAWEDNPVRPRARFATSSDAIPVDDLFVPAVLASGAWADNPAQSVRSRPAVASDSIPIDDAIVSSALPSIGWAPGDTRPAARASSRSADVLPTGPLGFAPVTSAIEWAAPAKNVRSPRPGSLDPQVAFGPIPFAPVTSAIDWSPSARNPPTRPVAPLDAAVALDPLPFAPVTAAIDWTPASANARPPRPVPLDAAYLDPLGFAPRTSYLDWTPATTIARPAPARANDVAAPLDATVTVTLAGLLEWAPIARNPPTRPSVTLDAAVALDTTTAPPLTKVLEWGSPARVAPVVPARSLDAYVLDPVFVAPAVTSWVEWTRPLASPAVRPAAASDAPYLDPLPFAPKTVAFDWAPNASRYVPARASASDGPTALDPLPFAPVTSLIEWAPSARNPPLRFATSPDAQVAVGPLPFAPGHSFLAWSTDLRTPGPPRPASLDITAPFDVFQAPALPSLLEWARPARVAPLVPVQSNDAHVLDDRYIPPPPTSWVEWTAPLPSPRITFAKTSDWGPIVAFSSGATAPLACYLVLMPEAGYFNVIGWSFQYPTGRNSLVDGQSVTLVTPQSKVAPMPIAELDLTIDPGASFTCATAWVSGGAGIPVASTTPTATFRQRPTDVPLVQLTATLSAYGQVTFGSPIPNFALVLDSATTIFVTLYPIQIMLTPAGTAAVGAVPFSRWKLNLVFPDGTSVDLVHGQVTADAV